MLTQVNKSALDPGYSLEAEKKQNRLILFSHNFFLLRKKRGHFNYEDP